MRLAKMGHKTHWYIEKRVVLIVYEGEINQEEMQQVNLELESFLSEGQPPVHLISDNRGMGQVDLSINLIADTFTTMKKSGWGSVILVDVPPIVRFFANVFGIQFGLKMKSVSTMELALEALHKHDPGLGLDIPS
jgi:hypothetical protein